MEKQNKTRQASYKSTDTLRIVGRHLRQTAYERIDLQQNIKSLYNYFILQSFSQSALEQVQSSIMKKTKELPSTLFEVRK